MIKSKSRCNVTSILYVIGATLMAFTDSAVTRCHTLIYESLLLKYGASKEATAWVIGIRNMLVWGGAWIPMWLCTKMRCSTVIMIGGVLKSIGMLLSGYMPELPYVYVTFGLIAGLGVTCTWDPAFIILSQHFDKQRGKAVGVACAGDPLGGLVMAPVIQLLFETYSYSGTMLILAAFSMHLVMAGLLMISHRSTKTRPSALQNLEEDTETRVIGSETDIRSMEACLMVENSNLNQVNSKPSTKTGCESALKDENNVKVMDISGLKRDDETINSPPLADDRKHAEVSTASLLNSTKSRTFIRKLVKFKLEMKHSWRFTWNPSFLALMFCLSVQLMARGPINTFMAGLALEKEISVMQSAYIVSVSSGLGLPATLIFGLLFDVKFFRRRRGLLYGTMTALYGALAALLPFASSYPVYGLVWTLYFLIACSYGQHITVMGDIVGKENLVKAVGLCGIVRAPFSLLGPVFGGLAKDKTGSYSYGYYGAGLACAAGGILFLIPEILKKIRGGTVNESKSTD